MRSSYWLCLAEQYDHSDLVGIVSRSFGLPVERCAFATTKSLRQVLVTGDTRLLRRRGW